MSEALTFARMIKYIEGYSFDDFFTSENVDGFLHYLYYNCKDFSSGKAKCYYGASKCVIISDDLPYVIKIPFNGFWDWEEKQDIPFFGAACDDGWDYCEAEENRFHLAEEFHFQKYLAKTEFVHITKNGIRIYTQPKCISGLRRIKPGTLKFYKTIESKYQENRKEKTTIPIYDINWVITFVNLYGYEELERFFDFLIENDWDDDLSSDNVGYINDKPVLIDYCGYWEQFLQSIWREQHGGYEDTL